MTSRTKVQVGLTAVAIMITAAVSSCTVPPIGRTQYCYWYPKPTVPTTAPSSTTTTTTTTTTVPTTAPRTKVCQDEPIDFGATTSTFVGYVAPVPAGMKRVK